MEGHHAPGSDRNLLARFRIAAGPLRLIAKLKIPKSGELDARAGDQSLSDFLKKDIDDLFGLPLIQARDFKQQIRQFGLGQAVMGGKIACEVNPC